VCGQAAEGLSPAEIFSHTEETLDNGLTHTASLAARLPTKEAIAVASVGTLRSSRAGTRTYRLQVVRLLFLSLRNLLGAGGVVLLLLNGLRL
jgi:hypothetical protein